jgi:hypothetical protein
LPKTFWATFDTREAAEQYGTQLERLLAQGVVPAALLEREPVRRQAWTVARCIAEYVRHNSVPVSDVKLLDTVRPSLALVSTSNLNYEWAEGWVRDVAQAPRDTRPEPTAAAQAWFRGVLISRERPLPAPAVTTTAPVPPRVRRWIQIVSIAAIDRAGSAARAGIDLRSPDPERFGGQG